MKIIWNLYGPQQHARIANVKMLVENLDSKHVLGMHVWEIVAYTITHTHIYETYTRWNNHFKETQIIEQNSNKHNNNTAE